MPGESGLDLPHEVLSLSWVAEFRSNESGQHIIRPLEGRIAAIADVFDALTSDRV